MPLENFARSVRELALDHFSGEVPAASEPVEGSGTVFTQGKRVYVVTKAQLPQFCLLGESDGFNIYEVEPPVDAETPLWKLLCAIDHRASGIPEQTPDRHKS